MKPSKSNFNLLSKTMNKLPVIGGVGLVGAGLMNQAAGNQSSEIQQQRNGGYVNKYADGSFVEGENPTINPILQNSINKAMGFPYNEVLPIDPYTKMPIKFLPEVTVAASKNSPQQWSYMTDDYNKRLIELEEDPGKWNINDWTKYGIKEGDASAEGVYDPLNWPAMALTAAAAIEGGIATLPMIGAGIDAIGTAALPYTTPILDALSAPAVIGGRTVPWLTGNNAMVAGFAGNVPGDIERGDYVSAGLNSFPLWGGTIIKGAGNLYNEGKSLFNQGKSMIKSYKDINVPFITDTPLITDTRPTNNLFIKSTQTGSALEKQVSKTGEVNINNLNAYINKQECLNKISLL